MIDLNHSDCAEFLDKLSDNSIEALITDPPAGIGFMGKEWDHHKGGRDEWVAWLTTIMRQVLRVLKPGAHGFVWAIPRTSHWTATALENAGFEIRDVVTHLFGSGFPKSLDISKAIDKAAGAIREVVATIKKTPSAAKCHEGWERPWAKDKTTMSITTPTTLEAKQWQGWGTALKPASEHWILIRKRDIDEECEGVALSVVSSTHLTMHGLREAGDLLALTVAEMSAPQKQKEKMLHVGRAVNGLDTTDMSRLAKEVTSIDLNTVSSWKRISDDDLNRVKTFITSTALKRITESKTLNSSALRSTQNDTGLVPESAHIILIRKPISEKTVAANVLKWGCGGINVDAGRIAPSSDYGRSAGNAKGTVNAHDGFDGKAFKIAERSADYASPQGRFPANLVLSHEPECEDGRCSIHCAAGMLDAQSGVLKTGNGPTKRAGLGYQGGEGNESESPRPKNEGGASRFFYCAKTSKSERNAGLDGMEAKPSQEYGLKNSVDKRPGRAEGNRTNEARQNHHPTVKPQKLMSYLIKLITPPGGVVLDPFMGSGSTGCAAKREGFEFIGIEKEKEYFEIAAKRIEATPLK